MGLILLVMGDTIMKFVANLLTQFKGFRFIHIILYCILVIVMFFSMFDNVKPENLNLKLGGVSEKTIHSPITIEDKELTDIKRSEAADSVVDQYILKKDYAENRVELISLIFTSVEDVTKELNTEYMNQNQQSDSDHLTSDKKNEGPTVTEKLERIKGMLPKELHFSDAVFTALFNSSQDQLNIAKDATITAVNNIMSEKISTENVEKAKESVDVQLKYTNVNQDLRGAIIEIAKFAIIPNWIFDKSQTEEKRQQVMDNVEPVKIIQGQIIVEEGNLISPEIYRKLELVGMLDGENPLQSAVGLLLLIGLMIAAIIYTFHSFTKQNEARNGPLLIFSIIFIITIIFLKIISLFHKIDYSDLGFIVPIAMGPLLIRMLINEKIAIIASMIFAVCGSIIFNEGITGSLNFKIGVYFLFSNLAGVLFLDQLNRRSRILQAGLFISAVNIIQIIAMLFLKNAHYSTIEISSYIIMGSVSGIGAAVLTIGLMPFFEAGFGILSTMKLIELSNPNHPLLRKILTETPGTYHHSVMVANLSDSACESIGANGLLARVAAYYHDIGKTKRPRYFIENQVNIDNPHDSIAPHISKNIIISHTTEGVELLKKYKMPKEIIDVAEQHHGTTLIKYFYHKAKEESNEDIDENEYRYPGPKPQSKESAIVSIADSVEAAVRSLKNPTPDKIELLVDNIIKNRLQDGQFNECDLTLKELDTIAKSLCETLNGIFHSRIEYPEDKK